MLQMEKEEKDIFPIIAHFLQIQIKKTPKRCKKNYIFTLSIFQNLVLACIFSKFGSYMYIFKIWFLYVYFQNLVLICIFS